MEICLNSSADRRERRLEVDDLKGNFSSEFTFLPNSQSILEEREHLQVYLRIRPFTSAERNSTESQDCVSIESADTVLLKPPSVSLSARLSVDRSLPHTGQRFQFSKVFGPETTQRELFEGTVKDLVRDVLHGANSLLFTYGVTNAGKTFTFLGPDADAGILPRSLDLIFNSIDERVFTGTGIKPQRCREFSRLSTEQQVEEAAFKRNLFRQLKESERSNVSLLNSTNKTLLEGASMLGTNVAAEDKISLEMPPHTKFSVWVSFCEIYNENIHDLLEVLPSGAPRRTVLRLSQDVKGNAFVKDLRWVQVTSAEEAFKVMKFGKKNQSFSSTRLNQVSSRSHSVFSVRVLKLEDVGTPRVHTVSELCLCDLAGSERCAKTQNRGERLKEAGNINTSMLILGKCINALRHNQQAKLLQHVPFRESKLTHYLQSFFCGRGKACMIVNINQCASMYDETLNVLKFSAVAQKVVVLTTKPLPIKPLRSASEVCTPRSSSRRSSLNGWESSLEDVQEDMDEDSLMETTVDPSGNEEGGKENDEKILISKVTQQRQVALLKQLQLQLKKERAEGLLMEARVREEISREFSELFSDMQKDYNERLAREREILEGRAERRMEIFKNLIDNMTNAGSSYDAKDLDKSLDPHSTELVEMKMAAEAARTASWEDRGSAVEELKTKMLETHEEQTARKRKGETSRDEEEGEKRKFLLQSSQISLVEDGRQRDQLQEALSTLEKEKKAREDVLAALEFQTLGKEEALASVVEERKAKEEALATVRELRRDRDEAAAALREMKQSRDDGEKAFLERLVKEREQQQQEVRELAAKLDLSEKKVTSEEERASQASLQLQTARAQLDQRLKEIQEKNSQILSLKQELQAETDLSSSDEPKRQVSELQRNLADEKEKSESRRLQILELERELVQTKEQLETINDEQDAPNLQLNELRTKFQEREEIISTLENQERDAKEQAELLRTKLQEREEIISTLENQERDAKEQAELLRTKLQEREEIISTLENQERDAKEQAELRRTKLQEREEIISTLENQERDAKEQAELLRTKLQEREEIISTLENQERDAKEQAELLRTKLQEREEIISTLENQERDAKEQAELLRTKLQEREEIISTLENQENVSTGEADQLRLKLKEQQVESQKLLEELKHDLKHQQETSNKLVTDLKQKFCEEEKTVELLRTELEEARLKRSSRSAAAEEELRRSNSELQTEVASLRSKVADIEEVKASEAQSTSETDKRMEDKPAACADLQKKLQEMEAQLTSLQKSLKEAQERRDEEEIQVVQEARRREAERRRELLAVAHEAIAQKDEELEKRAEEIIRLKENATQDSEKVTSLGVDLQRKEDEVSDMREKLADYKKQIQQVHKEVSVMREDEKLLRQRLNDAEKSRKQLQCDVASRDRSIQQLRAEQSSDSRSERNTCADLQAKERVMEDMRLALTEQEETQTQMEEVLEEKLHRIQELSEEVERLKASQGGGGGARVETQSHDLSLVRQEAAKAQEQLKLCTDKHQAERRKWLEEKLSLIGQAKEAEDKRNQEMRKFVDDRERYVRQQSRMESELSEKEQTMDMWRTERDTLVSALEVQLHKLLSSQAQKDKEIQELRRNTTQPPAEGDGGVAVGELQAALRERDADVQRLKEELKTMRDTEVTEANSSESPAALAGKPHSLAVNRKSAERRETRASVSSQGSSGFPSILESSEISTENGRMRRFPRPELEISFSPLQPNRMALRRQGDDNAVTVKITRSARKRKSGEMEKSHIFRRSKRQTTREEEVEAENRRNTRTKVPPKLTPHKEESSSPAGRVDSRSRKEGTLQKIGDFLQSSPTLLGTKAKKMVGLMSGRSEAESSSSSSSLSLRAKKNKRKLYRPEISSPMDLQSNTIISLDPEERERESDHQIIKRRLRSRILK
ncbi:kinesin-like protein KIF20B isoform X2 [Solea solea]|uniref:kinesin-like protein KIF20B isoform X2 n=1 Tax=Solea solea TaxID=90069 RepID=UPI00272C0B80|nr:kinesin-like protein KIF20B isoform X2 [Solea solea]